MSDQLNDAIGCAGARGQRLMHIGFDQPPIAACAIEQRTDLIGQRLTPPQAVRCAASNIVLTDTPNGTRITPMERRFRRFLIRVDQQRSAPSACYYS